MKCSCLSLLYALKTNSQNIPQPIQVSATASFEAKLAPYAFTYKTQLECSGSSGTVNALRLRLSRSVSGTKAPRVALEPTCVLAVPVAFPFKVQQSAPTSLPVLKRSASGRSVISTLEYIE